MPFSKTIMSILPRSVVARITASRWKRRDHSSPEGKAEGAGIERYEYSLFSQNGEDGILRHIFSEIGWTNRTFFEFGFGLYENNSLRLIFEEGCNGLFIDGNVETTSRFNDAMKLLGNNRARAINAFLDSEMLVKIVFEQKVPKDLDFLSIDVDGNDYWFWKTLDMLRPRLLAIEYNPSFGPQLSVTVPYDPHFYRMDKHPSGLYHGASLVALCKLGEERGYTLIGCDSMGVNAFFLRNDCVCASLPAVSPAQAFRPSKRRVERGLSEAEQFTVVTSLPLVEV